MKEKFVLRADHIKLLRAAQVQWQDCETGAPEIDPKRPYGNSDVPRDIAEILGWIDYGDELSEEQEEAALAIHKETEYALDIVLQNLSTKVPATYERETDYIADDYGKWRKK